MQKNRRKIRNDIILIAAVLLLAAIALIAYLAISKDGTKVVITVNGDTYASYPLDEDISVVISSEDDGSGINVLVISNGEAYINDASCPDLICTHHAPISREGEAIICLPNKTVVSIE